MKRGFESAREKEPEKTGEFQWGGALGAGLIAGAVLLIVPRGNPWSTLTFFSQVVMGRPLPAGMALALPAVWALHLVISVLYGLVVSLAAAVLTQKRAIIVGGFIGFGLYWLNLAAVSMFWPEWRANEPAVAFTHIVFGLVAGAVYRGLLRRNAIPAESA